MSAILTPRAGDLAKALREKAPPREIARVLLDAEPKRDPVPFRTISGPMEARLVPAGTRYGGRPTLWGTHSATNTQDMHGTWWARSALEEMRASALDRLSIWLNHEYRIPEDLLGTAVDATLEDRVDPRAGTAHTDLDIATLVMPEDVNPRAMQSYRAVQAGAKLGQSVGVFILDWEWQAPDGTRLADVEEDWCGPVPYEGEEPDPRLMITHAMMVESSLVGIPSNRRGWAHEAARALRRAGVLPPVGVERLARQRAHYLGASVGRITGKMVEQGRKAAAFYLSTTPDQPYEGYDKAERERMARFIIGAVKTGQPMPEDKPLPDLPESLLRDQSARITRIADEGCETRAPEQRSQNVDPEVATPGPDAARCADCGCTCRSGAPEAGCTCDCADYRDAREGTGTSAAVPGGDPAPVESDAAPDRTLAQSGRSLEDLDAALNASAGIVTGPVAVTPEDFGAVGDDAALEKTPEERAARKAAKRAAKQAKRVEEAALAADSGEIEMPLFNATPKEPSPGKQHEWKALTATPVEIALASEQLTALRAEIAAARATRDELAAESKALRKAAKLAARAIADADQTGLYRPTRRADALANVDLPPKALLEMSDADAIAALSARIPA